MGPKIPLDPNLVKALIASESGFESDADNGLRGKSRAIGLMQITDGTVPLLSERSKELNDHFVNITKKDGFVPNFTICAGIRWLFRKKEIADSGSEIAMDWRDAILKYKKYKSNDPHMKKFDDAYARLTGKNKPKSEDKKKNRN